MYTGSCFIDLKVNTLLICFTFDMWYALSAVNIVFFNISILTNKEKEVVLNEYLDVQWMFKENEKKKINIFFATIEAERVKKHDT